MGSMLRDRLTPARSAVLVVVLVAVTACTSADRAPTPLEASAVPGGACVVAAAGDVAAQEDLRTGAARTADLISSAGPGEGPALGDLAYPEGTPSEYADLYAATWGAFKDITVPTPGNHEYESDGKGYFDYFDVAPNHAVDLCGWRLVSVDQYAGLRQAAAFIAE